MGKKKNSPLALWKIFIQRFEKMFLRIKTTPKAEKSVLRQPFLRQRHLQRKKELFYWTQRPKAKSALIGSSSEPLTNGEKKNRAVGFSINPFNFHLEYLC